MSAEWVNAIASGFAAAGTIAAVITALRFSTLAESRRVERERRQQAELITGWLGEEGMDNDGPFFPFRIENSSKQCAYRMVVRLVAVHGAAGSVKTPLGTTAQGKNIVTVGLLPPGQTLGTIRFPGHAAGLRFGVEFAFQDASGIFWLRSGAGMRELKQDSATYYHLVEPVSWQG